MTVNVFAKAEVPVNAPEVKLSKMWKVCADAQYDAYKTRIFDDNYIALRTVKNRGRLRLRHLEMDLEENTLVIFRYDDVISYHALEEGWTFYWFEFFAYFMTLPIPVCCPARP